MASRGIVSSLALRAFRASPVKRICSTDKLGLQRRITGGKQHVAGEPRAVKGTQRIYPAQPTPKKAASFGDNAGVVLVVLAVGASCYWLGARQLKPTVSAQDTASTLPLSAVGPHQYATNELVLKTAQTEFVRIVGEGNVSTVAGDLKSHSTSDWSSHPAAVGNQPVAIVYPSSTENVSEIMKICHERHIAVTAFSGGTSLEGHFEPLHGGICIDFGRMDKILELHKDDLDVIVQPAVGWQDLNSELAEQNLFFPPDPGPGAMIGGMVGTGCSGTNAYRYGTMREWVISVTMVLADGTVVKTRRRPRKSSAGYDLTKMFIGSEGTLGLVTEATLKVTTLPQNTSVAVCSFNTVHDAASCVGRVVGESIPVAAVEILNEDCMKMINEAGATSRKWKAAPTLFFKFTGTSKNSVKEQVSQVRRMAEAAGSLSFDFAANKEECDELWSARHEALWSITSIKKEDEHVWTTDVAVPMSKLPDAIRDAQEDIKAYGLKGVIVGHVGDGNFHAFLLWNKEQRKKAEEVVHRMVKRAIEADGTPTGEHGVGIVKRDYLPEELGTDAVNAMRKIKQAFDPLCLLNCDKVVRMNTPAPGDE